MDGNTSAPILPIKCGHELRPLSLHVGTFATIGSGNMGKQPSHVSIDDGVNIITSVGVGIAVKGLLPLHILLEAFVEVISYRDYRLLNILYFLSFDKITQMGK